MGKKTIQTIDETKMDKGDVAHEYACACIHTHTHTHTHTHMHVHNGILFSHKKNEILPLATTWLDLEDIMLSEINHLKRHTIWFRLYVKSVLLIYFLILERKCKWRKGAEVQSGREREGERGRQGERQRENPKHAPCSVQCPTWGSIPQPWDHDLSSIKSWMLNWLSYKAPLYMKSTKTKQMNK